MNLWVSYGIGAAAGANAITVFQHSLVNLWVSYNAVLDSIDTAVNISAFSGESLGELRDFQE